VFVTLLEDSLAQLSALRRRREATLAQLEAREVDVKALLLKKDAKHAVEADVFRLAMEPLQALNKTLASQCDEQTGVLMGVNEAHATFLRCRASDAVLDRRERVLQAWNQDLGTWSRLHQLLNEGLGFYTTLMTTKLQPLKQNVDDFVCARRMERQNLLQNIAQSTAMLKVSTGLKPLSAQPYAHPNQQPSQYIQPQLQQQQQQHKQQQQQPQHHQQYQQQPSMYQPYRPSQAPTNQYQPPQTLTNQYQGPTMPTNQHQPPQMPTNQYQPQTPTAAYQHYQQPSQPYLPTQQQRPSSSPLATIPTAAPVHQPVLQQQPLYQHQQPQYQPQHQHPHQNQYQQQQQQQQQHQHPPVSPPAGGASATIGLSPPQLAKLQTVRTPSCLPSLFCRSIARCGPDALTVAFVLLIAAHFTSTHLANPILRTQVVAMGFDMGVARGALEKHRWEEQAAINALLS
jgi:hypothetical protein